MHAARPLLHSPAMSERSEFQQYVAVFAAQRRSAHWCPAASVMLDVSNDGMVHQ
jgi:hypothetical protein